MEVGQCLVKPQGCNAHNCGSGECLSQNSKSDASHPPRVPASNRLADCLIFLALRIGGYSHSGRQGDLLGVAFGRTTGLGHCFCGPLVQELDAGRKPEAESASPAIVDLIRGGRLKTVALAGKTLLFRSEVEAFVPQPRTYLSECKFREPIGTLRRTEISDSRESGRVHNDRDGRWLPPIPS